MVSNEMHASTSLASLQFQKNKYAKIFFHEVLHEHATEDEVDGAVQEVTDEVDYFIVLTEVTLFPFRLT
jgi:hypothetical protein